MQYCENCRLKVAGARHECPLCQGALSGNGCPEEEISGLLDAYGDCIIICDEVGNGIVPAGSAEREYRERVGRILILLAQRAEEVERVICGIGQKIK